MKFGLILSYFYRLIITYATVSPCHCHSASPHLHQLIPSFGGMLMFQPTHENALAAERKQINKGVVFWVQEANTFVSNYHIPYHTYTHDSSILLATVKNIVTT